MLLLPGTAFQGAFGVIGGGRQQGICVPLTEILLSGKTLCGGSSEVDGTWNQSRFQITLFSVFLSSSDKKCFDSQNSYPKNIISLCSAFGLKSNCSVSDQHSCSLKLTFLYRYFLQEGRILFDCMLAIQHSTRHTQSEAIIGYDQICD